MNTSTPVRGRFAPTPSGYLHIGNAITALLAWLQIRKLGGTFVLRIEDIDTRRLREEYVEAFIEDLSWLGIDWDEGPDVSGPYQLYRQRDRLEFYRDAFAQLQAQGVLYPCFCSRKEQLTATQAPHGLSSEGPVYSGRCRHLSSEQRAQKSAEKAPAWRFILPDKPIVFDDLVAGPQWFSAGFGGDFIIHRADGIYSYQLAVVVDDAKMGMTHVLRGDDLLDSTPRQLYLYEQLGLTPPVFAHVPLLYSASGHRLAKRDRDITLRSLRARGSSAQRVTGYLAWLAGLIEKPEAVAANELITHFDIKGVVRHPICLPENWLLSIAP